MKTNTTQKLFALGTVLFIIITGCANKDVSGETETSKITREITVSYFAEKGNVLDKAAQAFMMRHRDDAVNIETVSESMPITDYIYRTNVELASGGGPDIFKLNYIPWHTYAERGYLEDMLDLMESDPDFDEANYRMNVMDAVKYKGAQYIFPMSFTYNFLAFDATLLTSAQREAIQSASGFTIERLIDIAKDDFTGDNFLFGLSDGYKASSIFHLLLDENYTDFIDIINKKAYFDDGRFEELLLSVEKYREKGYIKDTAEYKDITWMGGDKRALEVVNPDFDYDAERFYFKIEDCASLLQNFDRGRELGIGYQDYYTPAYGYDKDDVIAGLKTDNKGGVLCDISDVYAINTNSKNKDTAWEFIKFLANEEMQKELIYGEFCIPVNVNAFKECMEITTKGNKMTSKSSVFNINNQDIYDAYIARMDSFADMADTYIIRDNKIETMIREEVTQYFAGTKSAKDTAAALQGKVNLYLSE